MAEIFKRDEQTGIQCGINDMGKLFLGDRLCWYNLEDTPGNREKLLADWAYAVKQQQEAENPPEIMGPEEWTGLGYKFQVNAAHVSAIYDELDSSLKRNGRRPDAGGVEVSSFLAGVMAALRVVSANVTHVEDWCHIQTTARRYFDQEE